MARVDLIKAMYSKCKTPLEFRFDSLYMPPMLNYLYINDMEKLYNIASSVHLSSKISYKYSEIDKILKNRGFKKLHAGTNRLVYTYLEDQSFVLKIAVDKVGMRDNPCEYQNQFILKPFITKVFETSPCGTIATVERVEPIISRHEFLAIAGDVFDLITNKLIGEYILEDIGSDYFMNWGIRAGFGPVLLDYPYLFPLDGNKLFCNKPIVELGEICGGVIDYDIGYNNLICTKCGKRYLATELQKYKDDNKIIFVRGESEIMKVSIRKGKEIIAKFYDDQKQSNTIKPKDEFEKDMDYKNRGRGPRLNNSQSNDIQKSDNIITTTSKFIPPLKPREVRINIPKSEDSKVITELIELKEKSKISSEYSDKGLETIKSTIKSQPSNKDMSDY
jgi:hypothetical protein